MKRLFIIIVFALAGLFAVALAVSPVPGPLAQLPGLQSNSDDSATCALEGYGDRGFPFKVDLYDPCQEYPLLQLGVVFLNLAVIAAAAYGAYKLVGVAKSSNKAQEPAAKPSRKNK